MARRSRPGGDEARAGRSRGRPARAPKKSHLATVLVGLGLGAVFFAANYVATGYHKKVDEENGTTAWTAEFGRPKTAIRYTWDSSLGEPPGVPEGAAKEVLSSGQQTNIGIAVAVIVVAVLFCEWRLYASASKYRGRDRRDDYEDEE